MAKFCLPIVASSQPLVHHRIARASSNYHLFEVWLDYLVDLDRSFIQSLCKQFNNRLIWVIRRLDFEPTRVSFEKRCELISLLHKTETYLDLDILLQRQEIDFVTQKNLDIKLLCSYHNYSTTPSNAELSEVLQMMRGLVPTSSYYKLATMCQCEDDTFRLLSLCRDLKKIELPFIVTGMGEHGRPVRIIAPLWGSQIIYAPEEITHATAPGQFTLAHYQDLFRILGFTVEAV